MLSKRIWPPCEVVHTWASAAPGDSRRIRGPRQTFLGLACRQQPVQDLQHMQQRPAHQRGPGDYVRVARRHRPGRRHWPFFVPANFAGSGRRDGSSWYRPPPPRPSRRRAASPVPDSPAPSLRRRPREDKTPSPPPSSSRSQGSRLPAESSADPEQRGSRCSSTCRNRFAARRGGCTCAYGAASWTGRVQSLLRHLKRKHGVRITARDNRCTRCGEDLPTKHSGHACLESGTSDHQRSEERHQCPRRTQSYSSARALCTHATRHQCDYARVPPRSPSFAPPSPVGSDGPPFGSRSGYDDVDVTGLLEAQARALHSLFRESPSQESWDRCEAAWAETLALTTAAVRLPQLLGESRPRAVNPDNATDIQVSTGGTDAGSEADPGRPFENLRDCPVGVGGTSAHNVGYCEHVPSPQ
ncbi:hypothetical protein HPB50_017766 [Hyalomma asiaticum]|uniref:Uncharacterized protein n=1 Tax=Hyalomma asiaticum TaxID=266040 RepID=A0ACB7TM61_HYAAI|nr:hypothetical protein HPB50_017766 [Hyalomma asiaticum]